MTRFIINKNTSSQQSVSADSYKLRDGFFHFYDDNSSPAKVVLTYKADSIISIWRQEDDSN